MPASILTRPIGSPVRATADGDVIQAASTSGGYGREIVIDHGHDMQYGIRASVGDRGGAWPACDPRPGDRLRGRFGPRPPGPHLHYEVRVHGVPVNPHKYLRVTYAQLELGNTGTAVAQLR